MLKLIIKKKICIIKSFCVISWQLSLGTCLNNTVVMGTVADQIRIENDVPVETQK